MFTARPVRTAAGQIILDEGCLLSAQTILHIHDYSIPGMDQGQQRFLRRASRLSAKTVRSGSFPFRAYPAKRRIQDFQSEFDSCTTMLHTALNDCILRAKSWRQTSFLQGPWICLRRILPHFPCSTCSITYGRSTIRLTHTASTSPLSPACSGTGSVFRRMPRTH